MSDRNRSEAESLELPIGTDNYRAYVGPPGEYDIMGATQFCLLTAAGLREWHRILDVGCGSLRLGRLLIPYLNGGNYVGLDPNAWLIDDAIDRHLGQDILRLKRPDFHHHSDFDLLKCGSAFDFVVAQSILSHCGLDLVSRILEASREVTSSAGLFLFTILDENSGPGHLDGLTTHGWVYPECTWFPSHRVEAAADASGMEVLRLPWFHARQTWYAARHAGSSAIWPQLDLQSGQFTNRGPRKR